jgi:hypothetical protein
MKLKDVKLEDRFKNHIREEKVNELVKKRRQKKAIWKPGHVSNWAMKNTSHREIESIDRLKGTQLFNQLYRQNEANFDERKKFCYVFSAFYQVCQDQFDEMREEMVRYKRDNKYKFEFFRHKDDYREKYDTIINHNLKKEIEEDIANSEFLIFYGF